MATQGRSDRSSGPAAGLVLAIDGGGTKTECLAATADGAIVGYGLGGPVNRSFVSEETAARSLAGAIEQALGGRRWPVEAIAFGATVAEDFARPVIERAACHRAFLNVGEERACLASVSPDDFGAVVLAGTGAFSWARDRQGRSHRADGWGALAGDQGSAYDLVRRALVAAARADDGRGPATTLGERFCRRLGTPSLKEACRLIYRERLERHEIAALAPLVSQAARDDAVAAGLLAETGELLAEGVIACIRRTGLGHEDFDVALCGGVFRAGEAVIRPIEQALAALAPGARVRRAAWPPVIGSLALALAAIGPRPGYRELESLAAGYRAALPDQARGPATVPMGDTQGR